MKNTICLILLFLFQACGNQHQNAESLSPPHPQSTLDSIFATEKFHPDNRYEPISLIYKGKPILKPGQSLEMLDSSLSFRPDPNLDYQDFFPIIRDYLSTDDHLSITLSQGSINGIFFFSADQEQKQIFNISGNWTIDARIDPKSIPEIEQAITEKLFPILKGKILFEPGWTFENYTNNYIEYFKLNPPEKNEPFWDLDYKLKMK